MLPSSKLALRLFAEVLDYPTPNVAGAARECQALVASGSPEAAAHLGEFLSAAQKMPAARLEEIYTSTFDLNPSCHPYVGYHLFGESYERSVFLVELKSRYRACGFSASENDLPDRLSVMLRFLAAGADENLEQEIIAEGMLPALRKMLGETGESDVRPRGREHVYGRVLEALRTMLQSLVPAPDAGEAASCRGGNSNG